MAPIIQYLKRTVDGLEIFFAEENKTERSLKTLENTPMQ